MIKLKPCSPGGTRKLIEEAPTGLMQRVEIDDYISRQAAIDALWKALYEYEHKTEKQFAELDDLDVGNWIQHRIFVQNMSDIDRQTILELPSAQPENQVHLCDSCRHVYPECPIEKDDVIFGNGKGNDNICACNKYEPSTQPEQRWIPISERLPKVREWVLCQCRAGIMDMLRLTEDGYWNKNYPHAEYMGSFVIAWMPLPEPYMEEKKK